MHAVIGVRGSFLSADSVESATEERTCRAGVTNLHAVVRRGPNQATFSFSSLPVAELSLGLLPAAVTNSTALAFERHN